MYRSMYDIVFFRRQHAPTGVRLCPLLAYRREEEGRRKIRSWVLLEGKQEMHALAKHQTCLFLTVNI